jgi:hypothetical protein
MVMMNNKKIQQAKDWLSQNNYDNDQYVFLNSNSPNGVNAEGKELEVVLAEYAEIILNQLKEADYLGDENDYNVD